MRRLQALVPLALSFAACGSQFRDAGVPDAGTHGEDAGHDAGSLDAGAPATDGGSSQSPDAGSPDAGSPCAPEAALALTLTDGGFELRSCAPAWTFGGALPPVENTSADTGSDRVGSYHETVFDFVSGPAQRGLIRTYDSSPIVLFTLEYPDGGPNGAGFPTLSILPSGLHGFGYAGTFAQYYFAPTAPSPDSPWVFFDDQANTFIFSEASHYMHAWVSQDAALTAAIDPAVPTLPPGFVQTALLVVEPGINRAFDTWGQALLSYAGKTPVSNESSVVLSSLGYWTGNLQSYYYTFDASLGYQGTLEAVVAGFQDAGVPLGYLQLDSWWYPKGPTDSWSTNWGNGIFTYAADPTLFPDGLASFQAQAGLPLVTHARWIDPASPYHGEYQMSANTITDPAYWTDRMGYLQGAGVTMYEQDWLDYNALPLGTNLVDREAFLGNMASAAAADGLPIMYCMPLPAHFLQSTLYPNVTTTRGSEDRFNPPYWSPFLYASRLASAVGLWPWSDAFLSSEPNNLILSVLSAGPVGVGDALGAVDAANLLHAARPDSVIVRPDTPLAPLDASFVNEANQAGGPMVAAAATQNGALLAAYVFAYQTGAGTLASFAPADLGFTGPVLVYDVFGGSATRQDAATAYTHDLSAGPAYLLVVPVDASGLAFVGDLGKYASLGHQRVASLSDYGAVQATIASAASEGSVTLSGYATAAPTVTATTGAVDAPTFDATTGRFDVAVHAAGGQAVIQIAP